MSKPARRVRDKWRSKQWYAVYTPTYFGEQNVANVPCASPEGIMSRVVENTLYDITGDFAHQSTKLHFMVTDLRGQRADTTLKGHEYATDYLRSLVRRGSTRVDAITDVTTKDGYLTTVSIVAFANGRLSASQQHALRAIMRNILEPRASALTYDQFVQEMVLGKVGSDIYNEAKKIAPIRHIGVRKSKLLKRPEIVKSPEADAESPEAEAKTPEIVKSPEADAESPEAEAKT
jgi:small subunit ribosomal protein S3Ae